LTVFLFDLRECVKFTGSFICPRQIMRILPGPALDFPMQGRLRDLLKFAKFARLSEAGQSGGQTGKRTKFRKLLAQAILKNDWQAF